jgi:hypothetical protein
VKGTKTQTSKKERRKSRNPDTIGGMKDECQSKFRSTWGDRVQKKEKGWRDSDVGTRREKRYWTGGEERGAECAMKRERQLSTCGIDVAE